MMLHTKMKCDMNFIIIPFHASPSYIQLYMFMCFSVCSYWGVTSCHQTPWRRSIFWFNMQARRNWGSGYCNRSSHLFWESSSSCGEHNTCWTFPAGSHIEFVVLLMLCKWMLSQVKSFPCEIFVKMMLSDIT